MKNSIPLLDKYFRVRHLDNIKALQICDNMVKKKEVVSVFVHRIDIRVLMEILISCGKYSTVERLALVNKGALAGALLFRLVVPELYRCNALLRKRRDWHMLRFPGRFVQAIHVGDGYGDIHFILLHDNEGKYEFTITTVTYSGRQLNHFYIYSDVDPLCRNTKCVLKTVMYKKNEFYLVAFITDASRAIVVSVYTPEGARIQKITCRYTEFLFADVMMALEKDELYVLGVNDFRDTGIPLFNMWKIQIAEHHQVIKLHATRCQRFSLPFVRSNLSVLPDGDDNDDYDSDDMDSDSEEDSDRNDGEGAEDGNNAVGDGAPSSTGMGADTSDVANTAENVTQVDEANTQGNSSTAVSGNGVALVSSETEGADVSVENSQGFLDTLDARNVVLRLSSTMLEAVGEKEYSVVTYTSRGCILGGSVLRQHHVYTCAAPIISMTEHCFNEYKEGYYTGPSVWNIYPPHLFVDGVKNKMVIGIPMVADHAITGVVPLGNDMHLNFYEWDLSGTQKGQNKAEFSIRVPHTGAIATHPNLRVFLGLNSASSFASTCVPVRHLAYGSILDIGGGGAIGAVLVDPHVVMVRNLTVT